MPRSGDIEIQPLRLLAVSFTERESPDGTTDCIVLYCIVMLWLDGATHPGLSMLDGATHYAWSNIFFISLAF